MSKAHFITPTGATPDVMTVRLGTAIAVGGVIGTGGSYLPGIDDGKIVQFVGESQYALAPQGALIEGIITGVEQALSGGWSIGGIVCNEEIFVTADGLQATPGVGAIAIGSFVVAGTLTPAGTALTAYPKVAQATMQLGEVAASLTEAGYQAKYSAYAWQVVSLGTAGTGAVGTTIVISRIGS